MRRLLQLCAVLLLVTANSLCYANNTDFERLYDRFLSTYWHPQVTINGIRTTVFDYARMKQDAQSPDSLFNQILQSLARLNPEQLKEAKEIKAFWINAYNFAATRLIIDHYPVNSIRSLRISLIKYPWFKKAIRIGGKNYSLKQIEKDILLEKFNDPRIVFAVSCAAVSCPDRIAEAFAGRHLDEQLDALIYAFFRNPHKGLRLDHEAHELTLSWILKKERHLFEKKQGGVLGFVLPYLEPETRSWLEANPVTLTYFKHDWTLNDLAQAQGLTRVLHPGSKLSFDELRNSP